MHTWLYSSGQLWPFFFNNGSGGIYIFEVKLTFESKLCVGNSMHFCHINRCSYDSVKVFETENVSTWEGLEPPTFGFMPNALAIWAITARQLLSHVFEYWLWRYRYFWGKVNILKVNCARATAIIFDTRTDALVKVSAIIVKCGMKLFIHS